MSHPFVGSGYAVARAFLRKARVAQENALLFAIAVYAAGDEGLVARQMRDYWDARRHYFIRQAMAARIKAKELREQVAFCRDEVAL